MILKCKLWVEGEFETGHCNSTCVIHVRTSSYQHAMKLMYHFLQVESAVFMTKHKYRCEQKSVRPDLLYASISSIISKLVNMTLILCTV